MRVRRVGTLLTAVTLVAAVASDARPQNRPPFLEVIDVPYLPQSEALCGGAAAAMVMRYWGARGVYAESFAGLVSQEEGGIRGADLLRSLQDRGWDARSFRGDATLVRSHLARRRPVVALIEDRPGRFHYVVLVAWPDGWVLVHDPARAPFRVVPEAEFFRGWDVAGRWTMLVLPGPGGVATTPAASSSEGVGAPPAAVGEPAGSCTAMVDEGVRLAGGGQMEAARRLFEVSARACPQASAPLRELAGLHALGGAWREAARDARQAVTRDPHDEHAWRILATASYLDGDPRGALDAWNHIGEPRVDLVEIKGLDRTRYGVIASSIAIEPQTLLTAPTLDRARRRVQAVPSVQASRVVYQPAENGQARVEAVIFERPMMPTSAPSLIALGVRVLSERELSVALSSLSGGGEVWSVAWRWWEHRPRVAIGFSTPVRSGGVLRLEAFDERQAYGSGGVSVDERRRGLVVALADWWRAGTRWEITGGVDRWANRVRTGSFGAGIERHLGGDAVVLSTQAEAWVGSLPTWTATAGVDWRSSQAHEGPVWSARAGMTAAGHDAPFALWHAAGSGPRADALLRAHPVLDGGRVGAVVFGRRLVHAGIEWRRWLPPVKRVARMAPALFVDTARAFDGEPFSDTRAHVDVGAGLRFVVPGAGVVGIDVGRGLRDGEMALSIGWRR